MRASTRPRASQCTSIACRLQRQGEYKYIYRRPRKAHTHSFGSGPQKPNRYGVQAPPSVAVSSSDDLNKSRARARSHSLRITVSTSGFTSATFRFLSVVLFLPDCPPCFLVFAFVFATESFRFELVPIALEILESTSGQKQV